MIAFFQRFFPKKSAPPDTYLDDLAREQQAAFAKFNALHSAWPKTATADEVYDAWWKYRFIQDKRTNAIVDGWHRVKVR